MMIQVYSEGEKWHLVRGLERTSLSIKVMGYCGDSRAVTQVQQLPSNYFPTVCDKCRAQYKKVLDAAPKPED